MPQQAPEYSEVIDRLNDLIQLDFDAIEAYQAAIDRLSDPEYRQNLGAFMNDHERHTRELSERVTSLGGTPKTKGDAKRILTKGKVVLANLAGDKAILKAMKSNEDDTNKAYENAVNDPACRAVETVLSTLERGLSDERRHREWIVNTLERMG